MAKAANEIRDFKESRVAWCRASLMRFRRCARAVLFYSSGAYAKISHQAPLNAQRRDGGGTHAKVLWIMSASCREKIWRWCMFTEKLRSAPWRNYAVSLEQRHRMQFQGSLAHTEFR